jgi:hypothetical protein
MAAGIVAVAGARAAAVPNPCALVPAATVASTVGLKGVMLKGKLSTRPDNGVKQSLCTYKHGSTAIEILVAPHQQSGGSGGPPGMKHVKVSGLGASATDFYDTNPKFAFANVAFTKGELDAGAYASGVIANAKIVALARVVYKALPS